MYDLSIEQWWYDLGSVTYFAGGVPEIHFKSLSLSFEVCIRIILWIKLVKSETVETTGWCLHGRLFQVFFTLATFTLSVGYVWKNLRKAACCEGLLFPIKMTKLLSCPHFLFQKLWYPRGKMVQKEIRKNELTSSSYLKTCYVELIAMTNKVTTKCHMTQGCSIPTWLKRKSSPWNIVRIFK